MHFLCVLASLREWIICYDVLIVLDRNKESQKKEIKKGNNETIVIPWFFKK